MNISSPLQISVNRRHPLPTGYEEPVVWKNVVGVELGGGNSIVKTVNNYQWGSWGASSVQELVSGDGYAEYRINNFHDYLMFGISNGDTDQTIDDIDYLIYPYPLTGRLLIYEKGVYVGTYESYRVGDRLRVGVESGTVKYRHNGKLLYESIVAPVYPLVVDTSLNSYMATVAAPVVAFHSLRKGLIHYWPLEEVMFSVRADLIGGWNLSEGNGATDVIPGKNGLAPAFIPGANRWLGCAAVSLPATFTIAAWHSMRKELQQSAGIASSIEIGGNQFILTWFKSGPYYMFSSGNTVSQLVTARHSPSVSDGYHLVVGEFDDSDRTARIIIDGSASQKTSALPGTPYRTPQNLLVGFTTFDAVGTSMPVDEVMIWDRVLTPAEHASLFNRGRGLFYPF